MDIIAAVEFGTVIPFPIPTTITDPKNELAEPKPKRLKLNDIDTPNSEIEIPNKTMMSFPIFIEKRPERKFPNTYPIAGIPTQIPSSLGASSKTSLPTKGAPPR